MEQLREKIEAQRKGLEDTAVWAVGEQLLDIAAESPENVEILKKDLEVKEMTIVEAEKQIANYAKEHRKGNVGFCSPGQADKILREFYGLPACGEVKTDSKQTPKADSYIDLGAFL